MSALNPVPRSQRHTLARMLVFMSIAWLGACATSQPDSNTESWIELQFIVDGRFEVRLKVPPAKMSPELVHGTFVATDEKSPANVFRASYDPGRGKNRGILLTWISAMIFQIEPLRDELDSVTIDDVWKQVYGTQEHAAFYYDSLGGFPFGGRTWLGVKTLSGAQPGVDYALPILDRYALVLTMSVFGKNARETALFKRREKTLRQVVESVRIILPQE